MIWQQQSLRGILFTRLLIIVSHKELDIISVVLNTRVNLSSMLEMALQLLPIEEMEVLDELLLLRQQKEAENNR